MSQLDTHLINITKDKIGLEIGGPSPSGQTIYANAKSVDNVIFSRDTVWSKHKDNTYNYYNGKTGKVHISDATQIKLGDGLYDFLYASHTLEHIANPLKAIHEWLRVIRNGGYLILILPEKSACFDHNRPYAKFATILEQYKRKVGEDDLSTLPDILKYHDLSMDKPAGTFEQFTKRSLDNFKNRCLHHYVYNPDLLREICSHVGCEFVYTVTNGLNMWFIMRKPGPRAPKSPKIMIKNYVDYHYEIIESVMVKHAEITGKQCPNAQFILNINPNPSFQKYLSGKYPNVTFVDKIDSKIPYEYVFNCTVYENDVRSSKIKLVEDGRHYYIAHEVTDYLLKSPYAYYLTPLRTTRFINADILPYSEQKIKSKIPIYIVQGNLTEYRRNYDLLVKILEKPTTLDYKIKLIGRGEFPPKLAKYKDKIILRNNLGFMEYHKEFLDGYCILPLTLKRTHPSYYTNKLTSTINYGKAYNLLFLIDRDLQNIYKLDKVAIFNDENDIADQFVKTLETFYQA